jgi:hypothetical protein
MQPPPKRDHEIIPQSPQQESPSNCLGFLVESVFLLQDSSGWIIISVS